MTNATQTTTPAPTHIVTDTSAQFHAGTPVYVRNEGRYIWVSENADGSEGCYMYHNDVEPIAR